MCLFEGLPQKKPLCGMFEQKKVEYPTAEMNKMLVSYGS